LVTSYQKKSGKGQRNEARDALEAHVQEGARKMLVAVLEEEVRTSWVDIAMSVVKHSAATGTDTIHPER
jgi:hypothetical protein